MMILYLKSKEINWRKEYFKRPFFVINISISTNSDLNIFEIIMFISLKNFSKKKIKLVKEKSTF